MFTKKAGKVLSQISDVIWRCTCLIKVDLIVHSQICWSQLEKLSGACECGGYSAGWASLHTHMVVVERSQDVAPSPCMMKQAVTHTWYFAVPHPSTTSTTETNNLQCLTPKSYQWHWSTFVTLVVCVKTGPVPEGCPTQELLLFWWTEGQWRGGLLWSQMIVEKTKDKWTKCRHSKHHGKTFSVLQNKHFKQ